MLGYVLVLVGFVFFANGMTLLGKTGGKEVGMLNGGVAVLILIAAFTGAGLGPEGAASTTLISVFALIYVIAFGVFTLGHDGKGLGWYCLFATIVFLWYASYFMGVGAMELGMFNIAWGALTLVAFLVLAQGKALGTLLAYMFIAEAFVTLLIPGMNLLLKGTFF
jgi:hypothetical protein